MYIKSNTTYHPIAPAWQLEIPTTPARPVRAAVPPTGPSQPRGTQIISLRAVTDITNYDSVQYPHHLADFRPKAASAPVPI